MYDHFDDRNQKQLHAFNKVIDLPGFVKTAGVSDADEVASIPSNCFADGVNRKYPVHTKKDTYLSRLYFTKNSSMYKEASQKDVVANNIDKAVNFWGLDTTYTVKEQAEKLSYSLPIVDYQGNEIDRWVLQTPRDFEKAAIQIFENKGMFTYPQRRQLARQMLKMPIAKEAELEEKVSEYLEKAAGYGMCTKGQALSALQNRASVYERKNPRFSEKLAELAVTIMEKDVKPALLEKVACVMDICDQELGYSRFYDKGTLETPEETLYLYTEKIASDIKDAYVQLQNGRNVEIEKIAEDKLNSFFEEYMGEVPDGDMSEKIAIVKSLPAPDADALLDFIDFMPKEAIATGEGMGVGNPKQGTGGTDTCYCPKCNIKVPHTRGTPCSQQKCSKCGGPLTGVSKK